MNKQWKELAADGAGGSRKEESHVDTLFPVARIGVSGQTPFHTGQDCQDSWTPENALNSVRVVLVLKCNTGLGDLNSIQSRLRRRRTQQ